MKIGVVGYSNNNFDESKAKELLLKSINQFLKADENGRYIEIVSGLTNIGIPKLAYEIADSLGYTKVGISAGRALKVACGIYAVDKTIIEGVEFGDESVLFVEYIDFLIRIGGGKQSRAEVSMFVDKCKLLCVNVADRLIEHELSLK